MKPKITLKNLYVVSRPGTQNGYGKTAKAAFKQWEKLSKERNLRRQSEQELSGLFAKADRERTEYLAKWTSQCQDYQKLEKDMRALRSAFSSAVKRFDAEKAALIKVVEDEKRRIEKAYRDRFGVVE
jgi:hypothetical protein